MAGPWEKKYVQDTWVCKCIESTNLCQGFILQTVKVPKPVVGVNVNFRYTVLSYELLTLHAHIAHFIQFQS